MGSLSRIAGTAAGGLARLCMNKRLVSTDWLELCYHKQVRDTVFVWWQLQHQIRFKQQIKVKDQHQICIPSYLTTVARGGKMYI